VNADTAFIFQIAKIKRRIAIRAMHGILLHASLIFLSINSFFFLFSITGITDNDIMGIGYFVPIGISLSAAVFIGFVTRSNLLKVLIDIDRCLNLQDRLSTAYEYLKFKKKTEFADLLLNDAAAKLGQLDRPQIVPIRFSWLHLLVIILLVINLFLYSGDFFTSGFESTPPELEKIANAGKLLNNYIISRIDDNAAGQSKSQSDYAKKLEQFSEKLNDPSKPAEQRFAALNSFLKEVRGEQTRLANELGRKLDSAGINELSIQKIPDLTDLSSSQLEKLKALLNGTPDKPIPDSIGQDIESLQELDGIEKLLTRIIDDFKGDRPATADSAETIINKRRMAQSGETPQNPSDDPNRPKPDGQRTANRTAQPGSGKLPEDGDALQDGMEPPEGYSTSAGRAKSEEEYRSSYELEKSPGAPMQDKTASTPAKSYLIHIRSLTNIGDARLKEAEIFQTYRREVESVLQKEDIPINYREYIKNYFISIGINTKENAHEF
jgi:hypothetical protein